MAGEFAKFFIEISSKFDPKGLKEAQNSIETTKDKASSLSDSFKKIGGILAGGLAIREVTSFLKDSFLAFAEEEKAVNNLNSQLRNLGIYTPSLSKDLQEFAGNIQNITTVSDDTTIELMRLGLSMGVSSNNIKEATKQAIGLSKAYGVDLNSAMKMVALAQQGEYTMLNRYIPQLRSLTSDTEKAAMTNRLLADGFKIAMSETETAGGKIELFKNRIDDLKKRIGKELLPVFDYWAEKLGKVLNVMDELAGQNDKYTAGLSRHQAELNAVIDTMEKRRKILEQYRKAGLQTNDNYLEEARQYAVLSKRKTELERIVAAERDKIQKESAKNTIKNLEKEIKSESPKASIAKVNIEEEEIVNKKRINQRKLEVDKWYLSERGIAEIDFYQRLYNTQIEWDALSLEQKEATMLKIQETSDKANSSFLTAFSFTVATLKAQGMDWMSSWDGMLSGTISGMSNEIEKFITSSGNMFENFSKLLDGIFNSILRSFTSMVSQMIAKWALLNIISGGGVSFFGPRILGSLSVGGRIKETGLYQLHEGEEVIPADIVSAIDSGDNVAPASYTNIKPSSNINFNQVVNIGGTSETNINVIAKKLTEATRNGLLEATELAKTAYKVGKSREGEIVL